MLRPLNIISILITVVFLSSRTEAQDAKLYILRSTGMQGGAKGFRAFVDGKLVCRLNDDRYSMHSIQPGERKIQVQPGGRKAKGNDQSITVHVEPGKTYYVLMTLLRPRFDDGLFCVEITESSAKTILPRLRQNARCLRDRDVAVD